MVLIVCGWLFEVRLGLGWLLCDLFAGVCLIACLMIELG